MAHDLVHAECTDGEQRKADDHVGHAARGHVEHDQEDGVEQKRAAQVAFERDDEQTDAPHDEQRVEQAQARELDAEHGAVGDGQQLAVLGQVAGEEQDDEDLGELTGLELEAADLDPQLGAIDLGADEHGQHEQDDAGDAQDVFVAFDDLEVLHHGERAYHEGHAQEQENHLAQRGVGLQTRDEGDADAREREHDGQDRRVGAGREDAHADMGRGECGEQSQRDGQRLEGERGARGDHVHGVEQRDGERGGYE